MKRLSAHKWVVVVGALVLTLAIGAGAWAVTGTPGMGAGNGGDRVSDCAGDCAGCLERGEAAEGGSAGAAGLWGGDRGGRMMPGLGNREAMGDRMQERLERWGDRGRAMLDLVREKMTAEDQAALDDLLQEAEGKRDVIRGALEELRRIHDQIRDLMDTYRPMDEAPAGETGEETRL